MQNWERINVCHGLLLWEPKETNRDPYLTPSTKINSKWIIDLNVKPKTPKLLKENKGEIFYDLGLGKNFLDTTSKAQSGTAKN